MILIHGRGGGGVNSINNYDKTELCCDPPHVLITIPTDPLLSCLQKLIFCD